MPLVFILLGFASLAPAYKIGVYFCWVSQAQHQPTIKCNRRLVVKNEPQQTIFNLLSLEQLIEPRVDFVGFRKLSTNLQDWR
jgi:hypothetical protein